MTQVILIGVLGKLIIYTVQKLPFLHNLHWKFLNDLIECPFCLGVWCYFFLSAVVGVTLFEDIFYVPLLSEIIFGVVMSFVVHLISIGFKERFLTIIME
jgi:hypothetical protein